MILITRALVRLLAMLLCCANGHATPIYAAPFVTYGDPPLISYEIEPPGFFLPELPDEIVGAALQSAGLTPVELATPTDVFLLGDIANGVLVVSSVGSDGYLIVDSVSPVAEPSSLAVFGMALAATVGWRARRRPRKVRYLYGQ